MKCPICHSEELRVIDSRNALESNAVKRRRECLGCMRRFNTFETIEMAVIQVLKRDGRYEDFQENKLLSGLQAACRHTHLGRDQVKAIVDCIKTEMFEKGIDQISSKELGSMVMTHLLDRDVIAYIRFACEYVRFKDINDLVEMIHKVTSYQEKVHQQSHTPAIEEVKQY